MVVTIVEGTENRNRLWVYPITDEDGRSGLGAPIKIIDEVRAEFAPVLTEGTTLYLRTDLDAERGRLVSVDLAAWSGGAGLPEFREVIAESEHTLASVDAVGDGFVAVYLVDAQPEVRRFAPDGTDLGRGARVRRGRAGSGRGAGRSGVLRRAVVDHLADRELPASMPRRGRSRRCRTWCRTGRARSSRRRSGWNGSGPPAPTARWCRTS